MRLFVDSMRNVLWLYRAYWKYGKLFIVLSLIFWFFLIPLSQFVTVYLPYTIIEALNGGRSFGEIIIIVILIQLVLMLQPVYEDIFNMFYKNKMLPKIEACLKRDIYEKAVETDHKYIDDTEYYGDYTWAVDKYANKAQEAQDLVNRTVSSLITVTSMLAIIAVLSPIAIVITVVGAVIENIMHIITNIFYVKNENEVAPHNRRFDYYHRIFYQNNYAADLKSTRIKEILFREYDKTLERKLSIIRHYAFKMIGWALGGTFAFYIARILIILNITHGIYTGNIPSVGMYMTMMLAVEKLKDTMNGLFYQIKEGNQIGLQAARIRTFFDTKSVIETSNNHKELAFCSAPFSVSFNNVCFNYNNSDFNISDFSLCITPGEKIAIVGKNGAGKSTLMKLLLRLYDVSSGNIEINGSDIRSINIHELRKNIGIAFQNPNIYALSFLENLELYTEIDEAERSKIFEMFSFDNVLNKNAADHSHELTKEFNANGIMLSGGEAQKIGIARLMAGNFGLLLFDEPSSALDPIAEHEMAKLILDSSNKSTTIIIAHRLSTIRNCDKIVVVNSGRIVEHGSHDALMTLKGEYHEMFTKQAENYIA